MIRSLLIALAAIALTGSASPCGSPCSGLQGSEAVCIESSAGCSCSSPSTAPLDTCIPAELFTSNGWKVPSECIPEGLAGQAKYGDCYNTGHPCCPGLTCVAACSKGVCGGEPPGCQGSICLNLGGTTPVTGSCLVESFTCPGGVAPIGRPGCNNPRICCGESGVAAGSCEICLGGDCPGNGVNFGTCAQGSCTNEVAAFTAYCCAQCDQTHPCPVGYACQNNQCGPPYCGAGNFVVPCATGMCPNNSTCAANNMCQCTAGHSGVTCGGAACNGQNCSYPNWWCP